MKKMKLYKKTIKTLWKAGLTPNLIGHRGTGKTEVTKQTVNELIEETGIPYRMVTLLIGNYSDQGDILGLGDFELDENGKKVATRYFKPNWWPRDGKPVVLFLDEWNRARPELINPVMELSNEKSLHGDKLPPGSLVIMAMNPPTIDYGGIQDIQDTALFDRACHIEWSPTLDDWSDYMTLELKADPYFVSFFQDNPKLIDPPLEKIDFSFIKPSRRKVTRTILLDQAIHPSKEVMKTIAIGMLGTEAGMAYMSRRDEAFESIKGVDVLDNFESVKERILKLSSINSKRTDIIHQTCSEIELELNKRHEDNTLKPDHVKNVGIFIRHIPSDVGFAFLRRIIKNPALIMMQDKYDIYNDQELLNFVTETKARIKKIQEEDAKAKEEHEKRIKEIEEGIQKALKKKQDEVKEVESITTEESSKNTDEEQEDE